MIERFVSCRGVGFRASETDWARAAAFPLLITAACCSSPAKPPPIAIAHVAVIDVVGGQTRSDMTVVVTGNRISTVGPAASTRIPDGSTILDGRGKFVIPGLWDMHVHAFVYVFSDFAGPLMIANGVTGARDMGYHIDTTLRWKADVAAGRQTGPRLVVGARVDGPISEARFISHVVTYEDGVRAFDTLSRGKDGSSRADFIKIYSHIPRAAYLAVAREAKKTGVPFAGHVPYSVSVIEASDAGQRSIEHEDDIMRACSSRDSVLRARRAAAGRRAEAEELAAIRAEGAELRASFDETKCRRVIETLARNGTWVTPTLTVYQPYARAFDSASTHPEWLQYVPGIVQGGWRRRASRVKPADSSIVTRYFSFARTGEMHRAGVRLLAGTDVALAFVYPGFSLHEELALLVKSGLTPLEALRTATYNPAEFLGALDSLGTVATGKVADLVVLDANPLADIRNTRLINAVIANGRLFDAGDRMRLFQRVRDALRPGTR